MKGKKRVDESLDDTSRVIANVSYFTNNLNIFKFINIFYKAETIAVLCMIMGQLEITPSKI